MRAAASTVIAGAALFAAGACGTDDTRERAPQQPPAERRDQADQRQRARAAQSGKELFAQRCGSCHTLADAGTTGTVGPDLDEHFGAHHRPHVAKILDTIRSGPGRMPANRVSGRDARAVARYVTRVTRE